MERSDSGVSDLIGTSLLIVMSVAIMGVIAVFALGETTPSEATWVDIATESNRDELRLVHEGGDPLALSTARLRLVVDGAAETLALDVFAPFLGAWWDPGEEVCLSGTKASCADYGGRSITEVGLVLADGSETTALSGGWTGSVTGLTPPAAAPDLAAALDGADPSTPRVGESVSFDALVRNQGTQDVTTPFSVRFYVEGTLVDDVQVSSLALGASVPVQGGPWTATAGTHTVRVVVDEPGLIPEESEANNAHWMTLEVAP